MSRVERVSGDARSRPAECCRNFSGKTRASGLDCCPYIGLVGSLSRETKGKTRKTLERTLHEEPIKGVRVVAAQSFGLARRRGIQIPVRHVAAASCRPRRAVEHRPSDRGGEQLVAPP